MRQAAIEQKHLFYSAALLPAERRAIIFQKLGKGKMWGYMELNKIKILFNVGEGKPGKRAPDRVYRAKLL